MICSAQLGRYKPLVDKALAEMEAQGVVPRLWQHDHTLWSPDPKEISNRLGWLHIAPGMCGQLPRLEALANQLRVERFTGAVLLGMGGSSLAPEVFRRVFGVARGYLDLAVLDSTDPGAVQALAARLEPATTAFIVSTKSGGTTETQSFFRFFYNWVGEHEGQDNAGAHFVAITDAGSSLAQLAETCRFRALFLNDPSIGGRYSALSHFGLVPAALIGLDLRKLLERAMEMSRRCQAEHGSAESEGNPAAHLGAILGEMALAGRDKLTLVTSEGLAPFGNWVEQLIAESTGKAGRGILPVVGEPLSDPAAYSDDRLFVVLQRRGDAGQDLRTHALVEAGHPVVRLQIDDAYDLGGQFFLWEMATAVAGSRLGINPFDQPNVEAAKEAARGVVDAYRRSGELPRASAASPSAGGLSEVLQHARRDRAAAALPQPYIALLAYVQPTPAADQALQELRAALGAKTGLAVTVGYGPRYLHSTGQLHKGDAGRGLFVLLTADEPVDVPIPDEPGATHSSITFGLLIAAQAEGDRQALEKAGRRVTAVHLGNDVVGGLRLLGAGLA